MGRILVTGGAGFLGSHLCSRLITEGNSVICVDNLFTGSKENVSELMNTPNFTFIYHDIVEPFFVEVDQIYNLACPASPIHYQCNPIQTTKTSICGALNMLELAKSNNARILQASTSEVYGDPKVHPQSEGYWGNVNPIGIRSCYDEGKRVAETLFCDYHRQYGLETKIIRIFNTYGPNMYIDDGRVVSNFIVQAIKNEEITIYGDGSQTRSFCYVDDLIEGMIMMMNSKKSLTGPINLGNPNEITILQLAKKIIRLTKSSSKIIFKELPVDDPAKRKPSIELAKRELEWKPTIELEQGLTKTINYFKEIFIRLEE